MIHPAAYPCRPHLGWRARRYPRSGRRTRRGLSALTAVLLLAGLLATVAMNWQIAVANERLRGQARHLAEVVAAEGYGLHHWLHQERIAGTVTDPGEDSAVDLSGDERTRLAAHSAIATWRRSSSNPEEVLLPRGWEIVHLIGRATGEDLPDGILVLRPDNDIVSRPTWDALARALDVVLGSGTGAAAADLASAALADFRPDCDEEARDDAIPACDRAYFASRFARLDMNAVLRQRHAGHPTLPMEAEIILGGHDLEGVGRLDGARITGTVEAVTLETGVLVLPAQNGEPPDQDDPDADPPIPRLTVNGDATLDTVVATGVTITGDVTGIDWTQRGDVTVSGTVRSPVLTACVNEEVNTDEDDLCEEGDLDLEDATSTTNWTQATIFGDWDRDQLTVTTTTTAATGIFGEITGTPDGLTVKKCFMSVTPFVHGARC